MSFCRKLNFRHFILSLLIALPAFFLTAAWPQCAAAQGESAAERRPVQTESADEIAAAQQDDTPDLTKAKPKFVRLDWSLIVFEDRKVGYVNKELNELHVDGKPVGHRLIINRFMKLTMAEDTPTYHQKSVLDMDSRWRAVSFTTETHRGAELTTVTGRIANGELATTITAGDAGDGSRTQKTKLQSPPVFSGAFLYAMAAEGLKIGATFSAATIDEQWGSYNAVQRQARVIRKTPVSSADGKGAAEVFVIAERIGFFETVHWVHDNGRIYRSEGGVHHLSVRESGMHAARELKQDDKVEYQHRIPIQMGRTLDSDVCGYQLTVPDYPYLPLVFRDGTLVIINNQFGLDHIMLTVMRAPAGGADEQRLVFRNFAGQLGLPTKAEESPITVDGAAGLRFTGSYNQNNREGWFETIVVSRGEFYYVFNQIGVWPAKRKPVGEILSDMIRSIKWTQIFGRERGQWDGPVYVSQSNKYRLKMAAEGWQIPQQRSGVPTSVEVVRDDRSALIAVEALELDHGTTLQQAAAAYVARLQQNMPKAENLKQQSHKVGGADGLAVSYEAAAIDDEPTLSRHLLTIHEGHLLVLTLVTKKSAVDENVTHFEAVAESLRLDRAAGQ